MLIHKHIRTQITQLLKQLNLTEDVWAGRPTFIDLDNTPLALAVFIDEAQCDSEMLCDKEWQAILNVVIYQKSATGEAPLDDVAEQIANHLEQAFNAQQLDCLNEMHLIGYNYEQDTQKRTWYIASLNYQINY